MQLLAQGAQGPTVIFCQQRLARHGFSPGPIDGFFGPQTEAAVLAFQAAHNLVADGLVGDRTWDMLLVEERVAPADEPLEAEKAALLAMLPDDLPADRRAVLEAAISTLGWREQPPGSNGGPEVDRITKRYYSAADEARYGLPPWCALAVCYWLKEGLQLVSWSELPFGRRIGAVRDLDAWGAQKGTIIAADEAPPVGAVFTMNRAGGADRGHTGLVVGSEGGLVVTVEGNTSNQVASRRREPTALRHFIRWW